MVQAGFEPKIVFICPLCSKEVEIIYGKEGWIAEHANCLNFAVIRKLPIENLYEELPLVFVILESDYSIIEAIEKLREILNEERNSTKRQRLEVGIKRMESRLGSANRLSISTELLKGGVFGLKVVVGRGINAYVWKAKEKFFGIVTSKNHFIGREDGIVVTSNEEEINKFITYWLHYWEKINF
ncbi:MAG: hypothetical protein NZ922_06470 [Candidatus Methanomethyliaceae archaeon]|nr:hypothetical protein [Candidatus Methanomethyliaceae archaeon]MDW7971256.1 hypothetical protein [Nitrososphaerota archaeon]